VALRNQLNPDDRQRKNRRHHHERAVAPPRPLRSTRNGLAHTVTGAQQPPVNHTANLPAPGIAGGGTAITTEASLPDVLPRAGLIDINGHDSPHAPTQRNTLIPPTHRGHIVLAGLLGLLDTANRSGPRKSARPLSPTPRCDKSVTTRPAAVITDRPAPRGESPAQRLVRRVNGMRGRRRPTWVSQLAENSSRPSGRRTLDKTRRSGSVSCAKMRRLRAVVDTESSAPALATSVIDKNSI
jgi:hypothetical protein